MKKIKKYLVKFNSPEKRKIPSFDNLKKARKVALTYLGGDVEITNAKGIVLPL